MMVGDGWGLMKVSDDGWWLIMVVKDGLHGGEMMVDGG